MVENEVASIATVQHKKTQNHIANVSLTASQKHKANQDQGMEAKGEDAALGTGVEFFA